MSSESRLLMDYPFLKQTGSDYRAHIASLSRRDSEKQISANTVRILLLEEQNIELREKAIISRSQSDEGGCYQVGIPTPQPCTYYMKNLVGSPSTVKPRGLDIPLPAQANLSQFSKRQRHL